MLTQELIDTFNRYFTVQFVTTDEQREAMYRLRYHVYAEEFGYVDPASLPDRREVDEYDEHSSACLIYHIPTNTLAACVRMVPGLSYEQLPIERYVLDSIFDTEVLEALNRDRAEWAEVSRLAVAKQFRRRSKEADTPLGYHSEDERTYPLLSVACFLSCIVLTDILTVEHCVASMEPFLPRLIKRSQLEFKEIGALTDYHGLRKTYVIHKDETLKRLNPETERLIQQIQMDMINQLLMIY